MWLRQTPNLPRQNKSWNVRPDIADRKIEQQHAAARTCTGSGLRRLLGTERTETKRKTNEWRRLVSLSSRAITIFTSKMRWHFPPYFTVSLCDRDFSSWRAISVSASTASPIPFSAISFRVVQDRQKTFRKLVICERNTKGGGRKICKNTVSLDESHVELL